MGDLRASLTTAAAVACSGPDTPVLEEPAAAAACKSQQQQRPAQDQIHQRGKSQQQLQRPIQSQHRSHQTCAGPGPSGTPEACSGPRPSGASEACLGPETPTACTRLGTSKACTGPELPDAACSGPTAREKPAQGLKTLMSRPLRP